MILTSNDDNSNENVYCIILWNNGIFIKRLWMRDKCDNNDNCNDKHKDN